MSGPIDVFGIAGQSNASGRGEAGSSPTTVPGMAFQHRAPQGLTTPADDPVGSAATGSAWPAFLNAFTTASGRPACVVPRAVGGSGLLPASTTHNGSWSPTGHHRAVAVAAFNDALSQLVEDGWEPQWRGVIWHQGENDALLGTALPTLEADYATALRALGAYFTQEVGPGEVFVLRVGTRIGHEAGSAAIRAAQDAVCADEGFFMAYNECIEFPDRGWVNPDGLHYNQVGLTHMGSRAGRSIAAHLGLAEESAGDPPVRTGTIAGRLRRVL